MDQLLKQLKTMNTAHYSFCAGRDYCTETCGRTFTKNTLLF